ncbi:hypothetical protein E2562_038377 [Oryza meyeriana var. granulata]|uniref:Uncharacterized protein n=1 Tax=Oryza meyeriana var. granulata TaxID=110450 RepID=A0A6G1DT94_9ORYZ|nr:hypothetical protein E2562_038377 [Oryza meyeriana var. granulata]
MEVGGSEDESVAAPVSGHGKKRPPSPATPPSDGEDSDDSCGGKLAFYYVPSCLGGAGHCYGCRNDGSPGIKHPNNPGAYTGGHLDGYLPFGLKDEEDMLRRKFKGFR